MAAADAANGRVVGLVPIGRGKDAVAFDSARRRVFSSNGRDGTITVYQQQSPDRYLPMAPVHTIVSARTMAVDPRSGKLFVAAADTDPSPTPGGRLQVRPGTVRLMIYAPQD